MMDAFEEAIFTRYAAQCAGCEHAADRLIDTGDLREIQFSTEIYDMNLPSSEGGIGLCFTERGLSNGWTNLFFGMMIIVITLIREVQSTIFSPQNLQSEIMTYHQISLPLVFTYVPIDCTQNCV